MFIRDYFFPVIPGPETLGVSARICGVEPLLPVRPWSVLTPELPGDVRSCVRTGGTKSVGHSGE
jgi:hypothetical protein